MDTRSLMVRAYEIATQSHDPSTQNGALLVFLGEVVAGGYNHVPKRSADELSEILSDRERKYKNVIHAEVDVLTRAARYGIRTEGLTMVAPWAACLPCAAVLIQSGIKELIVHGPRMDKGHPLGWVPQVNEAMGWLVKAGIQVRTLSEPLPQAPKILVAGEWWQP